MREPFALYEFFIEGRRRAESHVLLHITEQNPHDETKGALFVVCEIKHGTIAQIEHLQKMIDDIESGYYETDQTSKKHPFEQTLEFINHRTHHILQKDAGEVDCFVGIIEDNTIYFSIHGEPRALLMYQEQKSWQTVDLLEGRTNDTDDTIFCKVTKGTLADDDLLFIATPEVTEVFPLEELQQLFTSHTPKKSIETIQNHFEQIKDDLSFGGLLIHQPKKKKHLHEKKESLTIIPQHNTPPPNRPQKTELPRPETNYRPRPQTSKSTEPLWNRILIGIGKNLVIIVMGIALTIKKFLWWIGRQFLVLFLIATNHGNQRQTIIEEYRQGMRQKKQYIEELSLLSKLLFLGTIVLICVLSGSVIFMNKKKEQETVVAYQTEVTSIIQEKQQEAEASLLYGNESKALRLLEEIQSLLASLPVDSETIRITKEVTDQTENITKKLQKIEETPVTLVENISQYAKTSHMAYINGLLFLYDNNEKEHVLFHPGTHIVETKKYDTISSMIDSYVPKEDDEIFFLTNEDTIASWDEETKSMEQKDITYPQEKGSIRAMATYNRNLYTLDPIQNQIYKHTPTVTGFTKGTPWLQSNEADLTSAVDIAIDGQVYVLKQSGELLVFERGKQSSFNSASIQPPLEEPQEIWARYEYDNIYILEPRNKRIIEMTKQGSLIRQYTSSQWNNPSSMAVDPEKGLIYVLDEGNLYSIEIKD